MMDIFYLHQITNIITKQQISQLNTTHLYKMASNNNNMNNNMNINTPLLSDQQNEANKASSDNKKKENDNKTQSLAHKNAQEQSKKSNVPNLQLPSRFKKN